MNKRLSLAEWNISEEENYMFLAFGLLEYGEHLTSPDGFQEGNFESRALFSAEYVDGATAIQLFWSIRFIIGSLD